MGDLIHKLPMDELDISREETDSIVLLFGKKHCPSEPEPILPPPPSVTTTVHESSKRMNPATAPTPTPTTSTSTFVSRSHPSSDIVKEFIAIFTYSVVVFFFTIPYIDELFINFIPFCKNSWIVRNIIKAIVTAIVAWIIVNRHHMSGYGN